MKHFLTLFLAFVVTACASAPKGEPAISTTATGTVTVVGTVTVISTTTSTATDVTAAALATATATATATGTAMAKSAQDVIAGQVVGEEPMMEVSKHANVRLLQGGTELANITADPDGGFRFEGVFPKGRYEISVRDGKLHGAREITFSGGEMTNLSVIVSDGKGDKHHRRRRHRK